MDTASAIQAFSETDHTLPVEALRWTLDHWEEAFPELLARLEALPAGIEADDAEADIPFYFLHLCGDKAETRVFPALCRLMMTAEPIRRMLDDAITTTLSGILISTFGGDTAPLKAVIEAPEADEYVRHTGMMALAYLARTGSVPEAEMRAYLPHLFETMQPRTENYVWVGWADAIAGLGYADMRPMVEAAFDDERIGPWITEIKYFDANLRAALDDPTSMKAFEADQITPHTDTIEELSHWHGFSQEAKLASEQAAKKPATPFKPVTLEQRAAAVRQVGRNDPCPCGSGKKYKKCCLMLA